MLERIKASFGVNSTEKISSETSERPVTPEIEAVAKQVKYLEGDNAGIPQNIALEEALIRFGELTGQSHLSTEELHAEASRIYNEIPE